MTEKEKLLHEPVLLREVIEALKVQEVAHLNNQACFIDSTVGLGGHALEIIKHGVFVLGIEADKNMLEVAAERLKEACPTPEETGGCFKLIHGNFKDIDHIAKQEEVKSADGILFDLGVSTPQLTSDSRGFSFQNPLAELDMRVDQGSQAVSASDLINAFGKKELQSLFGKVLPYKTTIRLTKEILMARQKRKFKTVGDFLEIVSRSVPSSGVLNNATLPFMALRIAVNSELENLQEALPKAFELLENQGRLAVISFHSGEDAIVKNFFGEKENSLLATVITKSPVTPASTEVTINPRARSAKLRVLEKN